MKNLIIAILMQIVLTGTALAQNDFDFAKIVGRYEGTLEYADYKTDKRVTLKTKLEISLGDNSDSATFAFVYDDFGKTIKDQDRHRIDRRAKKYFINEDEFLIEELSVKGSTTKIILRGKQIDNDKLELVRKTIVFDGGALTISKETRQPFQFRNQYKFKRVAAGKSAVVKQSEVADFVRAQMQQHHIRVRGQKTGKISDWEDYEE